MTTNSAAEAAIVIDGIKVEFAKYPLDDRWYIHNGEWDENARFLHPDCQWHLSAYYWPKESAARAFARECQQREAGAFHAAAEAARIEHRAFLLNQIDATALTAERSEASPAVERALSAYKRGRQMIEENEQLRQRVSELERQFAAIKSETGVKRNAPTHAFMSALSLIHDLCESALRGAKP